MSEIRSQATPARDELAEAIKGYGKSFLGECEEVDVAKIEHSFDCMADGLADYLTEDAGWAKPRTVNSAVELEALPKCSLIRGLEREGQRSGDMFEKVGPNHWLCLDPGDRFDGEETTPSHAIVLIYKAGIRVLFTPGDAG